MRLIRFDHRGRTRVGRIEGDTVAVLDASWNEALLDPGMAASRTVTNVRRLAPIEDGRVFCAAVNYVAHRDEMGRAAVDRPPLFMRTAASLAGPDDAVVKPAVSDRFDFEGELAVVIGKPGRRIGRSEALDHVAGWSCFMDGSVRDWQRHTSQYTPGKNFDRSGSMGPWLMTPDEFGDYRARTLETRLNGVVVQRTAIDLMLYDVEALIEYISAFTELRTGDVIATGTCGGVGEKRVPPLFMFAGDKVEVEIGGLALLSNRVEEDVP